jgi:hypothetical protein
VRHCCLQLLPHGHALAWVIAAAALAVAAAVPAAAAGIDRSVGKLLLQHQHPLALPHHHGPKVPPVLLSARLPVLLLLQLIQVDVRVVPMPYPAHHPRDL